MLPGHRDASRHVPGCRDTPLYTTCPLLAVSSLSRGSLAQILISTIAEMSPSRRGPASASYLFMSPSTLTRSGSNFEVRPLGVGCAWLESVEDLPDSLKAVSVLDPYDQKEISISEKHHELGVKDRQTRLDLSYPLFKSGKLLRELRFVSISAN